MPEPIISKNTLYEFQEHLVGCSTLRAIEILFDSADIVYDNAYEPNVSGQRRTVIAKYYHRIDPTKWEDARRLLRVFEEVLAQLELRINEPSQYMRTDDDRRALDRLNLRLRHDGFVYQEGKIVSLGQVPSLTHLEFIAVTTDFPYLLRQLERIESSIDSDPWLAIGTAKELVETICKSILTDLNKPLTPGWELMDLCKVTRKELKLSAGGLLPQHHAVLRPDGKETPHAARHQELSRIGLPGGAHADRQEHTGHHSDSQTAPGEPADALRPADYRASDRRQPCRRRPGSQARRQEGQNAGTLSRPSPRAA